MSTSESLLRVRNLRTRFATRQGAVRAVGGVSFDVRAGEALAIVGESGSGKTATVLSVLRLLPRHASVTADEIRFDGRDLAGLDEREMQKVRGADIGVVFQEPMASLNPVLTVGRQITETLEVHQGRSRASARERAIELLGAVGIPKPERRFDDYPHQFSGGMCQRAMIAMALSCDPRLLVADEPTTALDVTVQAQIVALVAELRASRNMAMIWITHDLGVVSELADRVAVMYGGFIVESAPVEDLFAAPLHPYSLGLVASIPPLDGDRSARLSVIPGQPPDLQSPPPGCPFAERCDHAFDRCRSENPPLVEIEQRRSVACFWDVERSRERVAS